MKILFIDESINRVGGVERVVATLANKLSVDNDVEVVSEYQSSSSIFYKYNENIKINYLIDSRKYKTNNMKSKNFKYYFYRIFEKINNKIIFSKKVKDIIKKIDSYDVIIFGRAYVALDFLKNIKKKPNAKIIVRDSIHLEWYSKSIRLKIKKFFPRLVNFFIVSSEESLNRYKNFFELSDMKIVKIYNPLGITPNIGYNFQSKEIVSIGRLDKQKGFENLMKAVDIVFEKYPDWKLKIYGEGYYENSLIKLLEQCKNKDKIELLPTAKDVVSIFNNSSIFVFSSRYEGYANILVEALSCGIPSISYNWLMGAEEIIKDGENGLIVPLKNRIDYFKGIDNKIDVINLAKKIEYLIDHKNICDELSKKSVNIIESRNIDEIVEQWMKIIV